MKREIIICLIGILAYGSIVAQENSSEDEKSETNHQLKFATLLGYTFGNKPDLNNFNPEVFLGFDTLVISRNKGNQVLRLRFGPSMCTGSTKIDSENYYRALMMPGTLNISFSIYGANLFLDKQLGLLIHLGSNIKSIGFENDDISVIQNNISAGVGLEYLKLLLISVDHTWGWHNITQESEANFKQEYLTNKTFVSYLTVNVESYSQLLKVYFTFNWKKFLNSEDFGEGIYADTRSISVGLRKDLQLTSYIGSRNK